jgi:hypothetical protein
MAFHRAGYYAVNFGLDSDNVMRIGGWSAGANRWELDMSGNNTVAGSFRAPIFYDSNDTGYYVDPNGTSRLSTMLVGTGTYADIRLTDDESPNGQKYIHANGNYIGFLSGQGGWIFRVNNDGVAIAEGDMRSPIYYDYNNTGYYGDFAGTSIFNKVYYDSNMVSRNYGIGQIGVYSSTRYQAVFSMGESYILPADGTGVGNLYGLAWSYPGGQGGPSSNLGSHGLLLLENGGFQGAWGGGSFRTPGDARAPIFYDYNNTGYYADLNNTTYLYYLQSATTVRSDSDRRLKDNIETIPDALNKVQQLRGCTYTRKDVKDKTQRYMGMIAQEVLPIVPEVVGGSEESMYSLGYAELVPLLIEAVKELSAQVDALKKGS